LVCVGCVVHDDWESGCKPQMRSEWPCGAIRVIPIPEDTFAVATGLSVELKCVVDLHVVFVSKKRKEKHRGARHGCIIT